MTADASSDVQVERGNYLQAVTSKAAVIGTTRSSPRELGPFGITVNALTPSATYTEIERETQTIAVDGGATFRSPGRSVTNKRQSQAWAA